jgi:hypothetical protein
MHLLSSQPLHDTINSVPPAIQPLHEAILDRFHETIGRFPPPHAPGAPLPAIQPYRVGEYLIYLGYLRPRELDAALSAWRHQGLQPTIPLGCMLVARDLVPAPVLATVLLLQSLDRWEHLPALPPRFLGEQLLVDRFLTPDQLALVLQEQVEGYQHGHWTRLGDLIVHHGWLDQAALAQEIHHLHRI